MAVSSYVNAADQETPGLLIDYASVPKTQKIVNDVHGLQCLMERV